MEKLKKIILDYDIDITSLTEVNKDWRKVEYDNTIWGSTSGWRDNRRVQVSHNKTAAPGDSEFQVGGTAMLMLGDVSFRISEQGADSRNLGSCPTSHSGPAKPSVIAFSSIYSHNDETQN